MSNGSYDVGANWLCSWFDNSIAYSQPDEVRYGRPYAEGRTVVTFDGFRSEPAPSVDKNAVKSSLSAAESLRAKGAKSDALSLSLTSDEASAAALMIAALGMDLSPPTRAAPQPSADGWGQSAVLNRGLQSI